MKLVEQTRQMCRTTHYSPRTAEPYTGWVERFLRFRREAVALAQAALLSLTRAESEGSRELRRSLGAEPLPQELKIADLPLG
jgi:hypothetical protein